MDDQNKQVEEKENNQQAVIDMPDLPTDVKKNVSEPTKPTEDVEPTNEFNYKFYCNGCSGRAFLSEEKDMFDARTCQSCGANVYYNEGNYLPLNDQEKETFNR